MALCYHGIAKGQNFKNGGLPVGFEHEFHLITQNLIKNNKDCKFDIFLHSWSLDYKDEVIEKLKLIFLTNMLFWLAQMDLEKQTF